MSLLPNRLVWLHAAALALLFGLQFVLPEYHHLVLTRVMVLATFATGYNILFGYAGLPSLGHAMFFAAGLYGAGLGAYHLGWGPPLAFVAGLAAGIAAAFVIGVVVLRTVGVAFMIVTLMFGQAAYLAIFYFGAYTRGDEGLTLPETARRFEFFGTVVDLADAGLRYNLAFALLVVAVAVTFVLVRSPTGRVLVAIRENEPRATLLGYATSHYRLFAFLLSGALAGAAGAAYALLFGYVGASFASVQYSIYPLLWTLVGGAGTVAGPFFGTLLMFYLGDVARAYTSADLLVVGAALLLLVLYFPRGILGTIRARLRKRAA